MSNLVNTTNGVNTFPLSFHRTPQTFSNACDYAFGWESVDLACFDRLSSAATKLAWSPIEWKDGRRDHEYFKRARLGALDFDDKTQAEMDQICREWCDTKSLIMTTKSDEPNFRCFRLLFLFEREITNLDEYLFNIDWLIECYDADSNASSGSRFFWSGRNVVAKNEGDFLQPVRPLPANYTPIAFRAERALKRYRGLGKAKIFPLNIRNWLRGINVDNSRNTNCYYAAKYLTYWGMPPEEIKQTILKSKLPLQNSFSLREAEGAISRGIRKAKKVEEETKRRNTTNKS